MRFSLAPTPMCQSAWPPAIEAMGLPPAAVPGNRPPEAPDAPSEAPRLDQLRDAIAAAPPGDPVLIEVDRQVTPFFLALS